MFSAHPANVDYGDGDSAAGLGGKLLALQEEPVKVILFKLLRHHPDSGKPKEPNFMSTHIISS
jgi:hypothetical protein